MLRPRALLVVLIGLVAMVTVPSAGTASVNAKTIDPCTLLTTDAIGQALGGTAAEPTPSGSGQCSWEVTRIVDNGQAFDTVNLYLYKYDASAKKDVTKASKASTAKKLKIKGASIAFYDLSSSPIARVVKGKKFLTLQINSDVDQATLKAAFKTLCKTAAKGF